MKKVPSLKEVQEIYEKYKKFIWREIPKETKIKWKIKEIKFLEHDENSWCAARGDTIYIGQYYKPKSKILTSIIHEAIHLNTFNKKFNKKIFNKTIIWSENMHLSSEIATCILTNILIKKINHIFHKRFKRNRFDEDYKKYENKSKEFERKRDKKDFYEFLKFINERIK